MHVDEEQENGDDAAIGRALWRSIAILLGLGAVIGLVVGLMTYLNKPLEVEQTTLVPLPEKRESDQVTVPAIPFEDVTATVGIKWKHFSGREGEKLLPETMGGGVAVFDFDQDADQDLLFVGGKSWDWAQTSEPQPQSLCLYQNDGSGKFTDVTQAVGLDIELYGMSPVVGDFDNDGWSDLYITAVGRNRLFRNQGGKFQEVTEASGVAGSDSDWSTAATFFDFDRDGWLDLFVGNYVVWNRELDRSLGFSLTGVGRAYGQPNSFTGTQCQLYRNRQDGTFEDVSSEMGMLVNNPNTGVPIGKALGVAATDLNRDGWIDIVVANDTVQNFAFINQAGKGFTESGVAMGLAYDRSGNATGAMGIDCSFFRNDSSLAITIGNFANEPSSFYVSRSEMEPFDDSAMATGIGPVSRLNLTFGLFFADLDLDGRQDIVCANGHLEEQISKVQASQQYAQPPQFFWNAGPSGSSEFIALTEKEVGSAATMRMVGRGAAFGDLDDDGDVDVVLIANDGLPRLLRNDQHLGNNWMRLKLVGSQGSNRDAYGAQVELQAGGITQRRSVVSTRGYLSQSESTLTFGLGQSGSVDKIIINWPDGSQSELAGLPINQTHIIKQ